MSGTILISALPAAFGTVTISATDVLPVTIGYTGSSTGSTYAVSISMLFDLLGSSNPAFSTDVTLSANLLLTNLPISTSGLASGTVWNNGGVLCVA